MESKHYQSLSGGIMLIGVGLLFLIPGLGFWPWILVFVGAASLPASLAANKGWVGWQSFFWMIGLAVLFSSGFFWPGILILVGLSALIGGLVKRDVEPAEPVSEATFVSPAPATRADVSQPTKRLEEDKIVPAEDDDIVTTDLDEPYAEESESSE